MLQAAVSTVLLHVHSVLVNICNRLWEKGPLSADITIEYETMISYVIYLVTN